MRNIKLTLAYDGTDYSGWQAQPDQPTIQGEVARVLKQVSQQDVALHGAGRTDAGVHALGQVANFQTASRLSPSELHRAINALLPAAIRVLAAEEVPADFHARHSANGKVYSYRIVCDAVMPPFAARYALHHPGALDVHAMESATAHFIGEHDFTSFAASPDAGADSGERPSPVRTIWESSVLLVPAMEPPALPSGTLQFRVRGRSFLRYMVRKMVGTLLDVGRGRLQPADVARILAARDPGQSGATAPPHGLFMERVEY